MNGVRLPHNGGAIIVGKRDPELDRAPTLEFTTVEDGLVRLTLYGYSSVLQADGPMRLAQNGVFDLKVLQFTVAEMLRQGGL